MIFLFILLGIIAVIIVYYYTYDDRVTGLFNTPDIKRIAYMGSFMIGVSEQPVNCNITITKPQQLNQVQKLFMSSQSTPVRLELSYPYSEATFDEKGVIGKQLSVLCDSLDAYLVTDSSAHRYVPDSIYILGEIISCNILDDLSGDPNQALMMVTIDNINGITYSQGMSSEQRKNRKIRMIRVPR